MRARVWVMILVVQAALLWWTADSEIVRSVYLLCYSLMMPTVLYLLVGGALRRLLQLNTQEWLFGYAVLTATLPIVGFGGLRFLLPGMGYLSYFAPTNPQWSGYLAALPSLPVLHDPAAIDSFYKGRSGVPWAAWLIPIAFWSTYLLLLHGLWLGLAAALHKHWIRNEKLTFPVAALPLELSESRFALLRQPLFWLGALVPIVLQSLLVLHEWYPTVPAVQLKVAEYKAELFPTPPWNTIPSLGVSFYPMAAGLAYLMPSSVSFSCLAFWVLIRLAYPLATFFGLEAVGQGSGRFPYPLEQSAGAWLGSAALALWAGRRQLPSGVLVCAGLAAALLWGLGLPPAMAALAVAGYAGYVLAGARARAEAGGVWTFSPLTWTPGRVAFELSGAPRLEPRGLVAFGLSDLVHIDIRGQSLPYLMEALKLTDAQGIPARTLLRAVAAFSLTALAFGWLFSLPHFYELGAATAKSNGYIVTKTQVGMKEMHQLAGRTPGFDVPGLAGLGFGALFVGLLAFLRLRFVGFPLHPVGYVLGTTLTMNAFFLPTLAAWLTKTLVLRYGGSPAHKKALGFFMGMTLGDIGIQTFWTLFGRVFDLPVYQFLT